MFYNFGMKRCRGCLRLFSVSSIGEVRDLVKSLEFYPIHTKGKREEKGGKTVPVGRKMSPAVPGKERQGEYFVLLQGDKVPENFDHLFQRTDGDKFVDGVEIETAGGEVGAGEPLVGETGAIGAAADGDDLGSDAGLLHGGFGVMD